MLLCAAEEETNPKDIEFIVAVYQKVCEVRYKHEVQEIIEANCELVDNKEITIFHNKDVEKRWIVPAVLGAVAVLNLIYTTIATSVSMGLIADQKAETTQIRGELSQLQDNFVNTMKQLTKENAINLNITKELTNHLKGISNEMSQIGEKIDILNYTLCSTQ